jgi:hypothetical protein
MLRIHSLQQWLFGMKAHIGADLDSGFAHRLSATAANISKTYYCGLKLNTTQLHTLFVPANL